MTLSNSLCDLAERIRTIHEIATLAEQTLIEKSIEAGQMLVQGKAECPHGQWLPFLKCAGIQERWAQLLMKLARSEVKSELVRILGGVRPALRFLDNHKLPPSGHVTIYSDPDDDADHGPVIVIWEDTDHPGFYHVAGLHKGNAPQIEWTRRPINAEIGGAAILATVAEIAGQFLPNLELSIAPAAVPDLVSLHSDVQAGGGHG